MPIMLRPNSKAKKIAKNVMKLAQQYGSDVGMVGFEEFLKPSPLRHSKKKKKPEQIEEITGEIQI